MPIEDFKKELVANVPHLEKTPAKDTVEISKDPTEVQDKDAKTPAEAKVKDAKVDSKEVKVADTKKLKNLQKQKKELQQTKLQPKGKHRLKKLKNQKSVKNLM